MNYVTELLEEQKELLTEEMRFAEGKELEQTKQRMTDVVDALNKLAIHGVVLQSEQLPDENLYQPCEGCTTSCKSWEVFFCKKLVG
jgi:hypothetical protein